MLDAVLGLMIAVSATAAMAMAIEVSEASFARKGGLAPGLTPSEKEVLDAAGLSSHHADFSEFLQKQIF